MSHLWRFGISEDAALEERRLERLRPQVSHQGQIDAEQEEIERHGAAWGATEDAISLARYRDRPRVA